MKIEFDEIRPYNPQELGEIFEELILDSEFEMVMTKAFPNMPFEVFASNMRKCKTNLDFQAMFCKPFLNNLIEKFSDGITVDFDVKEKNKSYTYISNHRDIVLDSAFLSVLLFDLTDKTAEIAIGDNLLIRPWIRKLVRINKSFIVKRSASMREMLIASQRLSSYIRYVINDKKDSVWIAQREGRTKDSNDFTQESLLKMLAMNSKEPVIENLKAINIAPTTISYEYDPCDYLKATEFQLKRDFPEYKKTSADDLLNMQTGLMGYKGRIHYHISECINEELDKIDINTPKSDVFTTIATIIDSEIHRNYRIYQINYYCYDKLCNTNRFASMYSAEEKEKVESYMQGQLNKINIANKDIDFLSTKIYEMYANPLKNHLKATEK